MTQLPTEATVKELLSTMVGSEVTVQYAAQPSLDTANVGALARYVDDNGVLRALLACDLLVANALGAALALLPSDRVAQAVAAGEVPADIAENLHEVFNVGANLFNAPERPHLRLDQVLAAPAVPPELMAELLAAADRLDLDIDVPGFGSGPFAVVAAGPDSPTRQPAADPVASTGAPAQHTQAAEPPAAPVRVASPARDGVLSPFDFEAPLPLPATAPRLVSRVQDVAPRIGVALSVACGKIVVVTCTGAERVSSNHLTQVGQTWCYVDCKGFGKAILAVPARLTVVLADTLMSGSGAVSMTAGRAATTLEQRLVLRHLGPALQPLVQAFAGNGLTSLTVGAPETDPLPASIGDLVALRLLMKVGDSSDPETLTLALPARALLPGNEIPISSLSTVAAAALAEVPVDISLQLAPTTLSAADVEELTPGDVVRLDHSVDRPLLGLLDDRVVLHAILGKLGRRLAAQVTDVLNGG